MGSKSCTICLDEFQHPIILTCKHVFCESCINEWLNKNTTCPICRTTIVNSGLSINSNGETRMNLNIF